MLPSILNHPTNTLARSIEDLVMYGENRSLCVWGACAVTSRIASAVVFPIFLSMELLFKRVPGLVGAIGTEKFSDESDETLKYLFAIAPSMLLGLYSPEGMPGFFLERETTAKEVRPFGVEGMFSKTVLSEIDYPKSVEETQAIVKEAKHQGQQISVIGAGMSQGTQTVPTDANKRVIHTKHLNTIQVDTQNNTVTVGAGATWEEVQLELDKIDKSAIVKQASDIFSIGGSIGINCHGWAHEYGSISQTVRSLKVIDSNGNLRTLQRPRKGIPMEQLTEDEQLFKCMFGTLGYFGIIVEATLDIVDNEELLLETTEVECDQFSQFYDTQVKGQDTPLFGGRLTLDMLDGNPLRTVCMVSYKKIYGPKPLVNRKITQEPKRGTRVQRICLKLISHLPHFIAKKMISAFWKQEKADMFSGEFITRNEALHPPINAFKVFQASNLHAQWLQEYFIKKERLPNFLRFLGAELKANDVKLINATIRPAPKDDISILPYAEEDRLAVVICFPQKKSPSEIEKTRKWMNNVNAYLASENGVFYQAYMPYPTVEQFQTCYGSNSIKEMRRLKKIFDPNHIFGNAHTAKYYDADV